jgi:hypothetical protein
MIIGDMTFIILLGICLYFEPSFIFKTFKVKEKFTLIPNSKHVKRTKEDYQEQAIQADFLMSNFNNNKHILMPEYNIIERHLRSCPKDTCDEMDSKSPVCTEPDLEKGDNVWCPHKILKSKMFSNLETLEFKIYRRILPSQYTSLLISEKSKNFNNRQSFQNKSINQLNFFQRIFEKLKPANKTKSFASQMEMIGVFSFQELFYKLKVSLLLTGSGQSKSICNHQLHMRVLSM